MTNYEYSSYSSSATGGVGGGAAGVDAASGLFSQVDTNQDGSISQGEFSNFLGGAGGGAGQVGAGFGAGQVGAGVGGVSGSYESSSYSSTGGALGVDVGLAGVGGASSYDAASYSSGAGLNAGALGNTGLQTSTYESTTTGAGYDVAAVNQAAAYTAQTNVAWSQYGNEVRGVGLYVDANPQIVRRPAPGGVQTYTQNIKIRFLQPPPVPPPGPLIIKEVRPPQPAPPPPLRIKQQAPPLPQPPPLVLREKPPQPPATVASQTIVRKLAAIPVPPRSVIIERIPPAPPKPRDIIIERWVPYGAAAKRKTVVQKAQAAQAYAAPRNVIIQYEQAQVRVVRQFQRLGVTLANPQVYVQQYGAQLLDAQTLLQQARAAGVVEDLSPPAVAGGSFSSSYSQGASLGTGGVVGGGELLNVGGVVGGDLGGLSSSYSSSTYENSVGGAGGLVGTGLETGLVGGAGAGYNTGFVGGAGAGYGTGLVGGAGAGYGASSYESSFSSNTGGLVGGGATGFDVAGTTFNNADTNKDGTLDAGEFNKFVQGGL